MQTKALIILSLIIGKLYAISDYKTYSVAEGMPNSTVKTICQDSFGYMWMGTRNGLVRFDGYEFRSYYYNIEQVNSVSSNDITYFTLDKQGYIWIGTFNWITLFDPFSEQFIKLDLNYPEGVFPQGVVTKIWIDRKGGVWVSSKSGLYVIGDDKVWVVESLKGSNINSMDAIDSANLLVEVVGKGTAIYNITADKLEYINESKMEKRPLIFKIYTDKQGKIWLGADSNHIYEYDPQNKSLRRIPINLPSELKFDNEQIHDILEYNDTIIIFGTDNGLLAIDRNTKQYTPYIAPLKPTCLSNHRIMCLFQDNQDAIWVGTFGKGVKYISPKHYSFNFYDLTKGNTKVTGVVGDLVEKDGVLWIGHEQGVSYMDLTTGVVKHVDLESQLQIEGKKTETFFMYHDKTGDQLYFYLLNRGLFKLDTRTAHITERIDLSPASQVRSMATDSIGNIWIAEEELTIYNPCSQELNAFLSTNINNITSYTLTQGMLLRNNGSMLVGTRNSGIWEYPYDELNRHKYSVANQMNYEELKNKNVNVLFEDNKANLWIGTYASGLFFCPKGEKQPICYNTHNGLGNNSICGILEDEKTEHIWVTTINGISRLNPSTGNIINYTNRNGFPLEEVSHKAFLKASDGLFYVGGANGLTSFNPELFVKHSDSIRVTISLVKLLNEETNRPEYNFDNAESLKNIRIPHKYSSLHIKFSALNYFFPQGNKYCYMLEGIDEDWIITDRNEALYTTILPGGKYTFKVKASDNEGSWSDQIAEIQITITPPFKDTIWMYLLYALVAFIIGCIVYKLIINNRKEKDIQKMNQLEKDNIKKYYQMKLELFTKFSHELRTPLTLITGPAEDMLNDKTLLEKFRYPMELIHKNANRLLLLVNQLMDTRKMEYGNIKLHINQVDINNFLSEQIEDFNEFTHKKKIKLMYMNQYWGKNVWFDVELMEKVIFNLLSNAIKHTHSNGEVIICAKEKDNHLLISVLDNGEGIPAESQEKIFDSFYQVNEGKQIGMSGSGVGLNLAKYVVNLHGGRIWVESVVGEGSEFFIELPFGVSHFDESYTEIVRLKTDDDSESISDVSNMENEVNSNKMLVDNKTWILLVEDDEELRQYIVSQLRDDYSVIEVVDGREALATAIARIPDLIISNIMMPHMDGLELCRNVKSNINTAHIPVILLTAKVMSENIQEGYEVLADDYIMKPFNANLLKARIKNLIENRIHLRELFGNRMNTLDVPAAELTSTDPFLEKLFGIVESRVDDSELSISNIATEMGVSRAQFFRKIKAVSDVSPNKLILNFRMKMAVDMLRLENHTIAEIAYKVGFNDPAYFSKSFKSFFGVPPSDFIKQNLGIRHSKEI